jgi:hypothetical protein
VIDTIIAGATAVTDWFSAHPTVGAVVYAWTFGVCATQAAKRYYPVTWDGGRVKRVSQSTATLTAGVFAWWTWPATAMHAIPYAALVGMACPQVYTVAKWLLPNLMARWGWGSIVERKADKA